MNESPHRASPGATRAVVDNQQHNPTIKAAPVQQTNSILGIARGYIRRRWRVVPIPLGTKAPKIGGWPSLQITEAEAPQYFDRACNIGVILGDASNGLHDVDLDCPEAIDLAPAALLVTTAIFGRKSKRESHWLYFVKGHLPSMKFEDPVTGKVLLEIRGNSMQTVFPGSVHPSGELVEWDDDREPTTVEADRLLGAVKRLAGLSLGKRYCKDVVDEASLLMALKEFDLKIADQIRIWLGLQPGVSASHSHHRSTGIPGLGPKPAYLQDGATRPINLDHLNDSFPKSRAEPILEACAQMRRLRDDAANQGRDSWWLCVGVLAFCEDGDEIAHELSSEHAKYTSQETQRELDGWRAKADGATLCETFDRKCPGICGKCPSWGKINSPVRLGTNADQQNGAIKEQRRPEITPASGAANVKQRSSSQRAKDPGPREKLLRIALNAELWHDKDGVAFATITVQGHCETFAANSSAFKHWLLREYGTRYSFTTDAGICPSAPSDQAIKEAINALTAKAAGGAEYQVAVRVAEEGKSIYIDLGTPDWSVAEVSAIGWRIIQASPVRFVRPRGLQPLPVPTKGGNIRELRHFLNVRDEDFVLIVAWLLAVLRPTGPYPVLIVNGEHGAGKTMLCRVLRRSVDPNSGELRSDPRNERDLFLAAKNGRIVALDNLSCVRNDLSDAICRIATTGAFATRALYTDGEEYFMEVSRPILLNGIPSLASRADLADRAIVLNLPTMSDSSRRSEQEFWLQFNEAAPRLLGALLDGLSGALRNVSSVNLQKPCRMMDFAKWGEASWRAFGIQPGAFEEIYAQNRVRSGEDALDADPVALSILRLMASNTEWKGTATQLLAALGSYAPPGEREWRWPKDAARLSNHLKRSSPLLRQRGIEIEFVRAPNATRIRLIFLKKIEEK